MTDQVSNDDNRPQVGQYLDGGVVIRRGLLDELICELGWALYADELVSEVPGLQRFYDDVLTLYPEMRPAPVKPPRPRVSLQKPRSVPITPGMVADAAARQDQRRQKLSEVTTGAPGDIQTFRAFITWPKGQHPGADVIREMWLDQLKFMGGRSVDGVFLTSEPAYTSLMNPGTDGAFIDGLAYRDRPVTDQ